MPSAPHRIPAAKTPVTPQQAYQALQGAWVDRFDAAPRPDSLLCLLAQWALETGRGQSMWCFNMGNVKGRPDGSDGRSWCYFACDEVIDGHVKWFYPDDPACCFRAFESLEDGARDYLDELWHRFQKSWGAVVSGDPAMFAHQLKLQGYYTASEAQYTRTLVALFQEFAREAASPFDLSTVVGLQRALNELGAAPSLAVDGAMGPGTQAAVRAFQRAHGLVADGVAGPKTRAEIAAELSSPA
jgi:hypothetical protein